MNKHIFSILLCVAVVSCIGTCVEAQTTPSAWWRTTQFADVIDKLDSTPLQEIPVPILFGVAPGDFKDTWGDARAAGKVHEGTDIFAPRDSLVVSPTEAVVTRIDTTGAGGNAVYTANPGNETYYYAHLDGFAHGLKLGQVLHKGDLIGYVGNTGDASGSSTHLHFTIYTMQGPVNAFSRLTKQFSAQERLASVQSIVSVATDKQKTVRAFAEHYGAFFTQAQQQGLAIPADIAAALDTTTVQQQHPAPSPALTPTPSPLPTTISQSTAISQNLKVGMKGDDVKKLQRYLIDTNSGELAQILSTYGPTGIYGRLTMATVAEFQKKAGITPVSGYCGPVTRAYIAAHG